MTREEIETIQRRIKFCMKRHIPVKWSGIDYYPTAMILRYNETEGFYYAVELTDRNRTNSIITVGIDAVEFPTEGGGFTIAQKP